MRAIMLFQSIMTAGENTSHQIKLPAGDSLALRLVYCTSRGTTGAHSSLRMFSCMCMQGIYQYFCVSLSFSFCPLRVIDQILLWKKGVPVTHDSQLCCAASVLFRSRFERGYMSLYCSVAANTSYSPWLILCFSLCTNMSIKTGYRQGNKDEKLGNGVNCESWQIFFFFPCTYVIENRTENRPTLVENRVEVFVVVLMTTVSDSSSLMHIHTFLGS